MNQELLDAIDARDKAAIAGLLNAGIDVNEENPGSYSYLDYAWSFRGSYDFEVVKLLIDGGADLNEPGSPSIAAAARRGKAEEVQYVLDRGADINAVTHVGMSALWQAAYAGNLELIAFLLSRGLDIKRHGGHALQVASGHENLETVALLLDKGADINYQVFHEHSDKSNTPLHYAAIFGRLQIARYLLERGADPTLKNKYGERAFTVAESNKHREAAELIRSYEPQSLHDLDRRRKELKKAGLSASILKDIGEERRRVELPESKYMEYMEYGSILDVTEMELDGIRMLSLLTETDGYEALGFLVWLPSRKQLGSYDVEHSSLHILIDADWKAFRKNPALYLDRILDGEYEEEFLEEAE